ncbi:MAG: hypothetical protein IJX09_03525 [Clostridia bacterium]|nr:hypothetical protein [Clostridia bacterium]
MKKTFKILLALLLSAMLFVSMGACSCNSDGNKGSSGNGDTIGDEVADDIFD